VDIEHFEIMVKAMLCWSDEPKAPRKTMSRATLPAGERDELDAEEDEALVDDDEDDDDDEPAHTWRAAPAAAVPGDADPGQAGLPESEQLE
jgi:hypothetical protein